MWHGGSEGRKLKACGLEDQARQCCWVASGSRGASGNDKIEKGLCERGDRERCEKKKKKLWCS